MRPTAQAHPGEIQKGCGACIAACPIKASQQKGFETVQIYGMIDALTVGEGT